jgi:molybdenum cofactor cytidylyltransferase
MNMPAILLAAGESQRLGRPKQLIVLAGETLIARTVRIVREAEIFPLFVVLGGNRSLVEPEIDLSCALPVVNSKWQEGIATSICVGVAAVEDRYPESEAVLILVCDQPHLTSKHLQALKERYQRSAEQRIVASCYRGVAGIPAIFPKAHFPDLLALQGDSGAKQLLRQSDRRIETVDFPHGEIDIDTPEDLEIPMRDGVPD